MATAGSLIAVVLFAVVSAQQWAQGRHDGQQTGRSPYNGTLSGTEIWSFNCGYCFYSSPTIASDGTIYFGSEDYNVYALTPTGALKWSYATDNYVSSSTAVATDGTVFVMTAPNSPIDCTIYALNGSTGALKWSYTTDATSDTLPSPAIGVDGAVYFSTAAIVLAMNGSTGVPV